MKPTQGATEPSPFPMSGLVSSAACACNKKKKYCKNCFYCIKNTAIYIGHFDQENISMKISKTFFISNKSLTFCSSIKFNFGKERKKFLKN